MSSPYDQHLLKLNTNRLKRSTVINAKSMISCITLMLDNYYPDHMKELGMVEAVELLKDVNDQFDYTKDELEKVIKKQEDEIPKVIDETP